MRATARAPLSLRSWLLNSSLLAVLAGYAVLLLANWQLSLQNQRRDHAAAVRAIEAALQRPAASASPEVLAARLQQLIAPSQVVWLEAQGSKPLASPRAQGLAGLPVPLPRLQQEARARARPLNRSQTFSLGGRNWLATRSSLVGPSAAPAGLLLVVTDVTAAAEHQRLTQLLLLASAGLTTLFTSGLLRLVLRRGLRPLDQLSEQLASITTTSLGRERVAVHDQPRELVPIAAAFNSLLERLAQGWEQQRSFIDGVAHELRTPITLISGYAQRLQRDPHGDREAVARIAAEASRMARLVSDLLDISRDETGRLELSTGLVDADQALLEIFERLSPLAGGRLRLLPPAEDAAPDEAFWVRADPLRLQQCLTNLVENALRYTPAGSPIELFSSHDAGQVLLHVRDHGPGVPEAERERIFQRFQRGSAAASGSGLGLYLVRLLMQRMGGSVAVGPTPGGGADFLLALPALRRS